MVEGTEYYKLVERAVYNAPLALLSSKDKDTIDYLNQLLPYSTGFEIECNKGKNYNHLDFKSIPYIMDSPGAYESSEFRFRIPYGYNGLVCLFFITNRLKSNLELNNGSGIHYHVDLTDCWDQLEKIGLANIAKDLNENGFAESLINKLDSSVHHGGRYTKQLGVGKGYWMGLRTGHRTMEFRTGHMTFSYKDIVKCIISANQVIREFKSYFLTTDIVDEIIRQKEQETDVNLFINYLDGLTNSNTLKSKIKDIKEQIRSKRITSNTDEFNKGELGLDEINKIIRARTSTGRV